MLKVVAKTSINTLKRSRGKLTKLQRYRQFLALCLPKACKHLDQIQEGFNLFVHVEKVRADSNILSL